MAPSKSVWNPAHHPRDARGRFTKSATRVLKATDAKKAKAAIAGFKPTDLGPGAANGAEWIKRQAAATAAADDAVARYFAGGWKTTHQTLRTKKDANTDADVVAIDKAMQPLSDDVMLERRVSLKMFAHIPLEQLQGMKVRDAAYQPTALQGSQGEAPDGMVTIHMAVPAGTKAIVNPDTGAIVLDRDTETAISRVEPNGRGGYDLYGIVIPKAGAVKPTPAEGDTAQGDDTDTTGGDPGDQDSPAPTGGSTPAGGSAAAGGTTPPRKRTPAKATPPADAGEQGDDQGARTARKSTAGTSAADDEQDSAVTARAGDDDDLQGADAANLDDLEQQVEQGRPVTADVADLEAGAYARIEGEDQYGTRTRLTGYVTARPAPVTVKKNRRAKTGEQMLSVYVTETPNGAAGWRGQVLVAPDATAEILPEPVEFARRPNVLNVEARPVATIADVQRNDYVTVTGLDGSNREVTATGYAGAVVSIDSKRALIGLTEYPDGTGTGPRLYVKPSTPVTQARPPANPNVVLWKDRGGRSVSNPSQPMIVRGQAVRDPEREQQIKARIAELSPDTAGEQPSPEPADGSKLAELAPVDRAALAVLVEDQGPGIFQSPLTGRSFSDVGRYVSEAGTAKALTDRYGHGTIWAAAEEHARAHPETLARTTAEVEARRAERTAAASERATAAAAATKAGDYAGARAAIDAGEMTDPAHRENFRGWDQMRAIVARVEAKNTPAVPAQDDDSTAGTSAPSTRAAGDNGEVSPLGEDLDVPPPGATPIRADPDQGAGARIGDRITRPVDELLADPTIGPSDYSDAAEARTWPAELSVPDVAQTLEVDGRKIAIVRYRTLTMPTTADTPTLSWTDQFYAIPADTEFQPLRMSHLTQEHHGQPAGSAAAGVSNATALPVGKYRNMHIASGKTASAAASGARAKVEKDTARARHTPAALANIGVHDQADFDRLSPTAEINPGDLVVLRVFNKLRTGVATKVTANKVDALVSTPTGAYETWYGTAQKGVGVRLLRRTGTTPGATQSATGRAADPAYRAPYERGWRDSARSAPAALERAAVRNEPEPYYDGFRDFEDDREKYATAADRDAADSTAGTDAPAAPALDAAEERAAIAGRVFAQGQLDGVTPDDTRFRMRRARVGNRELDIYDEQGNRLGILHQEPGRDGWLTLPAHGRAGVTAPTFAAAVASLRAGEVSPEATPALPGPAAPAVDPEQRREQIADSMAGAQAQEIADAVDDAVDKAEPADPADARKVALEAKRAELAAARKAGEAVPMFGGSSKRKSFAVRVDANIRRTAEAFRNVERLEREVKALERPPAATAPAGGWTPEQLEGARVIRTRLGWHEVVKVNKKSVKVKAAPGMDDLVPYKRIIDARDANGAKVDAPTPDAGADNIGPKVTPDDSAAGTSAPGTPSPTANQIMHGALDGDGQVRRSEYSETVWPVIDELKAGGWIDDAGFVTATGQQHVRDYINAGTLQGQGRKLTRSQKEEALAQVDAYTPPPAAGTGTPAPDAPAAGAGNPDAVSVTRQADPFALVGDAGADDLDAAFGPTTPPAPAAPAVDVDSIAVDDEVRVAGQWATVTAKVDGQIRVRFPDNRLTLVNPADIRQHRAAVRVEDMFGGTTTFVAQDRATIGLATRGDVGRTRGQQDVQQVSMFDVADQVQIEGQTALLDAFLQMPTAEAPVSAQALLPADAPEPTRVNVPDDLTGWTDEQLAGLFADVVAQADYDEDGTLRITAEWDRREQEMTALLGMVPDDLSTLDDDAAAELFAELTSHHGTMDTEQVARLEADLDRRDREHVAALDALDAKRALVAMPVDQHADDDALIAAMNAAGDLGDEDATLRILDEIDRRDQEHREREAAAAAEAQAIKVAEAQARVQADAAAAAEANARAMDAPAEARLIVLEDLIEQANDADDAANDATNRDNPAEPGMADVSQSDLYATVITKMGSPEAQAAQREIARRKDAEARSLQTLENRRARRRLLNRDLSELTEDELTSLPALLDTLPGEDGATFREQKLADLRTEVTRRQQALDDKAARRAAGPDRNYRRADPVSDYGDLEYHFQTRHGEDAGRWQEAKELALGLQRQPDQFSSRPRPVPHKEWKKAVQASPRPWPDIAQSAVAWYRHLTEIDAPEQAETEGRARDFSTHSGWRSQPDAPEPLDPIAPADVAKADMVLYDMSRKAYEHRNRQGDESTVRRYILAKARAYRIPHNPNASLSELLEGGVEKKAGTAYARDPRSPQKAAADVIAEFRRLAAEDGVDPADTERFGPADRKSSARRAARGELTSDQQARIQAHLARGLTWEQAYAEAIGVDETVLRRQRADDLIRQAFASTAKDLAAAYRMAYTEHVMAAYQAAEDGTRGHLLNDAGKQLQAQGKLSSVELFSGPSTRAYKYASEELKRWWGEHPPPRLTFAEWKANMQGDPSAMAAAIQKAKGNEFA